MSEWKNYFLFIFMQLFHAFCSRDLRFGKSKIWKQCIVCVVEVRGGGHGEGGMGREGWKGNLMINRIPGDTWDCSAVSNQLLDRVHAVHVVDVHLGHGHGHGHGHGQFLPENYKGDFRFRCFTSNGSIIKINTFLNPCTKNADKEPVEKYIYFFSSFITFSAGCP